MFDMVKELDTMNKKEMRRWNTFFHIAYFCLLLVAPTIIITVRYGILKDVSAGTKLSGIGLILFLCLGVYIYSLIKRKVVNWQQDTYKQRRLKFTTMMLLDCIPLIVILIAGILVRNDAGKAFDTFLWCIGFILGAQIIDGLWLKFFDAETALRNEVVHDKEKVKRRDLV